MHMLYDYMLMYVCVWFIHSNHSNCFENYASIIVGFSKHYVLEMKRKNQNMTVIRDLEVA